MGRRKKKKKSSSVHQQNTAAPPVVSASPAPKATPQVRDKEDSTLPRDFSESERFEAALQERSPFTGKLEPYDVEAHGLKWEEMPLSEELPAVLTRMNGGKRRDEERKQPKVQVDPALAAESAAESLREQGPKHDDRLDEGLESKPRSRAGLYVFGALVVGVLAVVVFFRPGLVTRGVGADVVAALDVPTETLPSSVRVMTDSDEGAAVDEASQTDAESVPGESAEPEAEPARDDTGAPDGGEAAANGEEEVVVAAAALEPKEEQKASKERGDDPSGPATARRSQAERAASRKDSAEAASESSSGSSSESEAASESEDPDTVASLKDWQTGFKRATGWKNKVEFLRKYIGSHPRDDAAMAKLATMLMEMSFSRGEADSLARKAADLNPDNAAAWLVIGYVYQLGGDKKAADNAYRKCAQSSGPAYYVTECRRLL